MTKKCIVTLDNDYVTVVKYGDTYIQFPAMGIKSEYVWVKYENGKYTIVDEETAKKESERTEIKKTTKSKTKIKKSEIDENV